MKFSHGARPRHRRAWWRLWRYCRCGFRWPCPDSIGHTPMPYQPPPVPPLTRREYRAATRATPSVELTTQERAEIQALAPETDGTPDAPPLPTRPRPTNRGPDRDAPARPHLANGRPAASTRGPEHRTRRGTRV